MIINPHSFPKILYGELHLHLGGALQPRILWHHIDEVEKDYDLLKDFKNYNDFEAFFRKERNSLEEYLKMHDVVEPIQTMDRLEYFIKRLMRGAFVFENLSYLELRYCPYSRTNAPSEEEKIKQMRAVVLLIDRAIKENTKHYPIVIKQILCMHSRDKYSPEVNRAILDLAIEFKDSGIVSGIDLAGGEKAYDERFDEILGNYKTAFENGVKTTAHIFETKDTPDKCRKLIPYLNRIGHGIQIPLKYHYLLPELKERDICLEICPTTYFKCGTFENYHQLKPIFSLCEEAGVDITLCTDNGGMHMVRLQEEFENLLIHRVVNYKQLDKMRNNAFKHAFGLDDEEKKLFIQPIQ